MDAMKGKVVVVTGANSGIGEATAGKLAALGAHVVLACRSAGRGEQAAARIRKAQPNARVDVMLCDLSSQTSIRDFAHNVQEHFDRLDVLVNNAALVPRKREQSEDGLEIQLAVNHLAPFLLTNLLLDRLKESTPARVVTVSSEIHRGVDVNFDDLQSKTRYKSLLRYRETKLMNVLFTRELARRLEGTGVTANCLHPGVVRTNLFRFLPAPIRAIAVPISYLFMLSPDDGAKTSVYLASAPEAANASGKFFDKCKEVLSSPESLNDAAARRLWAESEKLCGLASNGDE